MNNATSVEPYGTIYPYQPSSRFGRLVFLAGQIAKTSLTEIHASGRCGEEVDLETARESARRAAWQAVAWLERETGEDERVDRILDLVVNVAVGADFLEISEVADAASEVFNETFGANGVHSRTVIGVNRLPRNAPVLLQVTAALAERQAARAATGGLVSDRAAQDVSERVSAMDIQPPVMHLN